VVVARKAVNIATEIPAEAIETLARCLLPEIQNFFESESGKREFECKRQITADIQTEYKK
jgi:hypothetical protein